MGVTIHEDSFGSLYDEETKTSHPIRRFTLKNSNSVSVQIISYGAIITTINVPDRSGNLADVNLGFDDIDGWQIGN
jgi:aldose 1-epimerase